MDPPPWPTPEAAGLDPAALQRLVEGAKTSHADALVVVRDGSVVLEDHFGTPDTPIEAMSVTKSVVSLAVGMLLDEGRITSLDQPVSDFYAEWKMGRKARITVRHLLNHTSGLQQVLYAAEDLDPRPDLVRLALAADLETEPGAVWVYNNRAVDLLPGIVWKASGQRMDEYLRERLFTPLGITDHSWARDGAGNPVGKAGLQIRPRDLARIGEMMASGGLWRGRRIVSAAWIEASTRQAGQELNPLNGLLWWLGVGKLESKLVDDAGLAGLRRAGAEPTLVAKVARLRDRTVESEEEAARLIRSALGPQGPELWMREVIDRGVWPKHRWVSPPTVFAARGFRGQYLWVSPGERLVVVTMHRDPGPGVRSITLETQEFPGFFSLAGALPSQAK